MEVTYWLVDSDGNTASQKAWINITPVNDPPNIADCPNLFVRYDSPYAFDYTPYISDADDPLSMLILTTDDVTNSSVNGLVVTYTYPESSVNNEEFVTVIVSDGKRGASDLIMITITSDYPPIIVKQLPDVTLFENETKLAVFDLDYYIMDPDGDSLYMVTGYSHLSITIHDDHTVDFSAPEDWYGTEEITFRARDPTGAIVEQRINVVVLPINDPPAIDPLPDMLIHYDYPHTFDLWWYLADTDNAIEELIISTSNPDNVTVDGTEITLIYPEYWGGQHYPYEVPLTIFVSDGVNTTSQVLNVTVGDDYPPGIIYRIDDMFFYEDETVIGAYNLNDYFIDIDNDTMYYTFGQININVFIHENQTVDISAPPDWFGSEYITIRAADGNGAFVEDTIKVTVLPVNDAPSIAEISDQWANNGETWVLDLSSYISDIDNEHNELEVTVHSSEGEQYISISGMFLTFQYPDGVKNDTVTVTVSDGVSTTSRTFSVTIGSPENKKSYWEENLAFWALLLAIFVIIMELVALRLHYGKFKVHEVFVIHNTGFIIAHVKDESAGTTGDEDQGGALIAGMDLIRGSVGGKSTSSTTERLKVMGKFLIAEKGEEMYLLVVYTGDVKKQVLGEIKNLVKELEERYSEVLEDWCGDTDDFEGIEGYLQGLLGTHEGDAPSVPENELTSAPSLDEDDQWPLTDNILAPPLSLDVDDLSPLPENILVQPLSLNEEDIPPSPKTELPPPPKTKLPPPSKTKLPPPSKTRLPPPSKTRLPPPLKTRLPPPPKTKMRSPHTKKELLPPPKTKLRPPNTKKENPMPQSKKKIPPPMLEE